MEHDSFAPSSPSITSPTSVGSPALHPDNSFPGKDISILVVDDEITTRIIVKRVLQRCGYADVEVVDGSRKALESIERKKYDLILSDLHMPDIDGIGLVQQVRTDPERDMPIVMMSGTEDLDSVYRCLRAGADDYLLKPIQENAVKNLWKNVWRKREEKKTMVQLTDERSKRTKMDQEMKEIREENERLKSQFSEAVETPINVITRTVGEISKKENLSDDVKRALGVIVKSLGSSNLYRPAFSKLLEQSAGGELDSVTRRWLSSELKYEGTSESGTPTDHNRFGMTWPQVKPTEPGHLESLRSWEFDVWGHTSDDLLPLIVDMFDDFRLFEMYSIEKDKFQKFLLTIRDGYSKTAPYHNFRHAFDVIQAAYIFLTRANAAKYMTHLEILALLIGALGHDLGHPGTNNTFHICTASMLAIRYNDRAVLENFHCSELFDILSKPETNILKAMKEDEFKDFRKLTISLILATDMSSHNEHLGKFGTIQESLTRENKEHREMLLTMVMKASDISNPARPEMISRYWSDLIQEEFFRQGDKEKELGLKVSPFMDRDEPAMTKMSIGFIDFFVKGLYGQLHKILPEVEECVNRIAETRSRWVQLKEEEEKAQKEQAEKKAKALEAKKV